jgi:tetratricopeptide (TPR) repeat protein
MKRVILTGILALATGVASLMAQAQPAQTPATQAPAAPKGPQPKSKSEVEALQALQAAQGDPDKTIAACENLITKFADTEFKSIALFLEASAYEKKKDYEHMVIYAEKFLELNPQDIQANLMLAKYYLTATRENDLDREEKLGKGEKYANAVIEIGKTAPKPNPGISDTDWADARKDMTAEAYNAMGLGNMVRKKFDASAANFKSAMEANSRPEPAYMVRAANALQSAGKNDEAIALCDKIAADPNVHPQIKQVAANVRAAAIKAGGKAPGGGPAPEAK